MFYEEFSTKEYLQITHLILIAKDKSLKISCDDCIKRWTPLNYFFAIFINCSICNKTIVKCRL